MLACFNYGFQVKFYLNPLPKCHLHVSSKEKHRNFLLLFTDAEEGYTALETGTKVISIY